MIKGLMDNPYAWGFLSMCTIVSLVFAVYTWVVGRKSKEISVDYHTNEIIRKGKSPIPKLDVKFDRKEIQNLSSTIFYIWNSGNDVINQVDIVTTKPLTVKCSAEHILDAQIIKKSEESNAFVITNQTTSEIELAFDYIDSNEGIKLQVFHTGSSGELAIECKIKGGKAIRDCRKIRNKGVKGFWISVLDELMPTVILAMSMPIVIVLLHMVGISYNDYKIQVVTFSLFVGIICMFLYLKIKKTIQKALYRSVPDELKK